jgi:hypothetical protein
VAHPVVIDGCTLVVADSVAVSFQRYPENALRGVGKVPRSYGALPVELSSPRDAFVPAQRGEGIWLGLSARGQQERAVRVEWLGADGSPNAPCGWSARLSGLQCLHGLHRPDGTFCPFIRAPLSPGLTPCQGVAISVDDAGVVQVRFVSAPQFEAQTGKPAPRPMSPDNCYGGWRLP